MTNVRILGAFDAHEVAITCQATCACGWRREAATQDALLVMVGEHRLAAQEEEDKC